MKRVISVILTLTVTAGALFLSGCVNGSESGGTSYAPASVSSDNEAYEIVMISGSGGIDDKSFNSGTWEGVTAYASSRGITHIYLQPASEGTADCLASIDKAVTSGAKVIILPGSDFCAAVYEAQSSYPDTKFIILDGTPESSDGASAGALTNTAAIMFSEEECGFLAGYAAVKDGYLQLGFVGGKPLSAVQAFLYGYIQGAETAAKELKLADGKVSLTYAFTGDFNETDANRALAADMYKGGAEVIFACCGAAAKSVIAASEDENGKVIGVDSDMRSYSKNVITSAKKELSAAVQLVLASIYETNTFETYSGKTTYFNAANGGVGLPVSVDGDKSADAFDRFKSFDRAAYDEIFKKLSEGTIKPLREIAAFEAGNAASAEDITAALSLTKVTVISVGGAS